MIDFGSWRGDLPEPPLDEGLGASIQVLGQGIPAAGTAKRPTELGRMSI